MIEFARPRILLLKSDIGNYILTCIAGHTDYYLTNEIGILRSATGLSFEVVASYVASSKEQGYHYTHYMFKSMILRDFNKFIPTYGRHDASRSFWLEDLPTEYITYLPARLKKLDMYLQEVMVEMDTKDICPSDRYHYILDTLKKRESK